MTRKIFVLIVIEMVKLGKCDELPPTQSAYRPERSTADNVLNEKLLMSRYENYRQEVEVLSLDLLNAFDTLSSGKFLKILDNILDEDEMRMIRTHLCGKCMIIKVDKTLERASTPMLEHRR